MNYRETSANIKIFVAALIISKRNLLSLRDIREGLKAFTLTDTEPLAAALASVGDEAKKVRVSGEVDAVCQAKGCWLVLKDGDQSVRIFTKGHAFFLPTTIKGRKAEAEGTVKARTHSKAFAKHLAEDSGEDPAKVDAPKKEFVMDASSVKVLPSS